MEAAFWLLDPESRIWYLYVASPVVAKHGARHAYELALAALRATGSEIPLAQLKMIRPSAPSSEASGPPSTSTAQPG